MKKLETDILKILEEDCRYTPAKIALMLEKTEKEVWTGSSDELSGKLYGFLNEKRFLSELR